MNFVIFTKWTQKVIELKSDNILELSNSANVFPNNIKYIYITMSGELVPYSLTVDCYTSSYNPTLKMCY